MKKIVFFVLVGATILSCASSKNQITETQRQALEELVASKSFVIESDWAMPIVTNGLLAVQNAGLIAPNAGSVSRINLIGNTNELRLKGDSISSQLPYFGEVQMPTQYNGIDNGISFNGIIENYEVVKHEKGYYALSFDAISHNENFDVEIKLYPSMKSDMILRGSRRFQIRYEGNVRPIKLADSKN